LVVGIDVAKETHYARAFDNRGIELSKLLRFSNTASRISKTGRVDAKHKSAA
jgi:transposase